MNPEVVQTALAGPAGSFSLFALFWQSHIVVKLVIIGLIVASIWCWAIIVDKLLLYARTKRNMDQFETVFWSGQSLEQLYQQVSARDAYGIAALFVAAMREWKRTYKSGVRSLHGLGGRIDRVMDVTLAREVDRLERRLLVLATVGSSGPFIGLFGTVWGIMTSFQAIAASNNTNLSVVAPGIAEALLATALGLLAAIPAVVFYNKFAAQVARLCDPHGRLRRRVRGDPVAADRRAGRRLMAGVVPASAVPTGRRHKARRRHLPMSEINVTPFVDVMLVLLIVFMVTAPLLTVGVPIDLPETQAKQMEGDSEPITVSINADGKIFLQDEEVDADKLVTTLQAIAQNGLNERVFVRGDRNADYGTIMRVMGRLNSAGYKRIGLVTLEETDS